MKIRRWLLTCSAMLLVATVAWGKPGTVVTKDGQKFVGEITERAEDVVVNVKGVETTILRGNIDSLTYSDSFEQEFNTKLSKLAADDVKGRIELAHWAFDQKQYEKARDVLNDALVIDPNSKEATEMLNLVRGQMRLEQVKPHDTDPGNGPKSTTPPNPIAPLDRKMLQPADINTIRQRELKRGDNVNIRFEKSVIKRFAAADNRDFDEFNRLGKTEQAMMIFDRGDPSMQEDIKIVGDPQSILEYRQKIQPIVLNGCASVQCHGGPHGGNLVLFSPADNDAATYSNFYILMQYRKKVEGTDVGIFGGSTERRMIDRGNGARSLMAEFGLPADVSVVDHPKVGTWNGLFRGKDDPKYRNLVKWMNESLAALAKDYKIRYDAPGAGAESPTTHPAK